MSSPVPIVEMHLIMGGNDCLAAAGWDDIALFVVIDPAAELVLYAAFSEQDARSWAVSQGWSVKPNDSPSAIGLASPSG